MMSRKLTCEELEQRIKELESNIDKRKQAEEALRDSKARPKALSDASFEAIFFSEKGVCLDQNRTAERMFGYTHSEAVGRNGNDWIIPEDRARVKNNMLSGYEKPYKATALRKEGTTFPCEILSRMINCQGRSIQITALRDITESKKTEVTLKLYKGIVDSFSEHIFLLDRNYIYRYVNNAYLAVHKKSREEIVGHSISELMGKEVFDGLIKEKIDRCLAGNLIRYELWFDFPGLGKRFMDVVYHPYSENSGSVSGIIVVSQDITRQKIAEKVLAEKTALLDNILKNAQNIAIATTDLDFRINYYNPMAEKLFGYTEKEVFGKIVKEIHTKENVDFKQFERAVEIVCSKGKYCYSVMQETEDGPRYLESQVMGIFDPADVMVGFSLFCRDVTKSRRAEKALRKSEEQFRQLLESAGDAVFLHDKDGRFVQVNEQASRNLGYSRNELLALHTWDVEVGWTRNDLTEIFRNVRTGYPETHEGTHRRKDGSTFPVEVRISMFQWKSYDFMLAFARDITERKQVEMALRQREQYLGGLNEAMQALLIPADMVPFQEFVDKIGQASGASRTYVFINHQDEDGSLTMSRKAEWCAKGINSKTDNPKPQGIFYDACCPRWKDMLEHGDIISGPVSGFPADERKILEPQGILAILIIPIMVDGLFIGFIGFDNCVSECELNTVVQTFLRVAANDLAQAIKRTQAEKLVRASLKEKEVLLREIHHRVKNNMQVIVSLLRMHSRNIDDARLAQIFDDCRCRVNAMALIHEALYLSDDLARIDFAVYLKKLCRNLSQMYGAYGKGIKVTVELCNVVLDMDQGIALGMVISELISNAFKHAFLPGKRGSVSVNLSCLEGKNVELIVKDDGKGLPPEIDILNTRSLGLRLASAAVTRELDGSIEVERNCGTRFIIHFKCK